MLENFWVWQIELLDGLLNYFKYANIAQRRSWAYDAPERKKIGFFLNYNKKFFLCQFWERNFQLNVRAYGRFQVERHFQLSRSAYVGAWAGRRRTRGGFHFQREWGAYGPAQVVRHGKGSSKSYKTVTNGYKMITVR